MYKCIICEYEMKFTDGLGLHLSKKHNLNIQTYYETFLYKNGEDKCKICGLQKRIITCREKYGCDNPSQNTEIHKKQMFGKFVSPNGKFYDSSWEYKF